MLTFLPTRIIIIIRLKCPEEEVSGGNGIRSCLLLE